MDKDINARIAELEAKIDALEDDLVLMYDSLNRRIDDQAHERSSRITYWGIAVAIALLK